MFHRKFVLLPFVKKLYTVGALSRIRDFSIGFLPHMILEKRWKEICFDAMKYCTYAKIYFKISVK